MVMSVSGANPNISSLLPASLTIVDIHSYCISKPQTLMSLSLHQRRKKFNVTYAADEIRIRLQSTAFISMAETAMGTDSSPKDTAVDP